MQAAGQEIEIYPIKVLFDTLETSELRLSRKPKMNLSHLVEPTDGAEMQEVPAAEPAATVADAPATDAFADMSEESVPV